MEKALKELPNCLYNHLLKRIHPGSFYQVVENLHEIVQIGTKPQAKQVPSSTKEDQVPRPYLFFRWC